MICFLLRQVFYRQMKRASYFTGAYGWLSVSLLAS